MTNEEYAQWRKDDQPWRYGRVLKGIRDNVVIIGIPSGRPEDRYFEGFIIKTETTMYPLGYFSSAWLAEAFEFDDGKVAYEKGTKAI